MSAGQHAVTAAGVRADDEERWFDELCDAIDQYTCVLRDYNEAGKADRERFLASKVHDAKRNVIDRFYAAGWDK